MNQQDLKECIAEVKNSDIPNPSRKKIMNILYERMYKDGWIPCSEKMPDVPDGLEYDDCPEFNVTIDGAARSTTLRCASDGTWFDDSGFVYTVAAWQPLPEPYTQK